MAVAEPLAQYRSHELILARPASAGTDLAAATARLDGPRDALVARGVPTRTAAFTSPTRGQDIARFAVQQDVDLLLVDAPAELLGEGLLEGELGDLLTTAPCDVALLHCEQAAIAPINPDLPILAPFGGAEHEWAAVEIGAWLANSTGCALQLAGTKGDARAESGNASMLLANVSIVLQRALRVNEHADSARARSGRDGACGQPGEPARPRPLRALA